MPEARAEERDKRRALYIAGFSGAVAILVALSIMASQSSGWTAAVGVCLIIFFAAAAVGSAFGFLFAVPRLLADRATDAANDVTSDVDASARKRDNTSASAKGATPAELSTRLLRSNSNLERISDWLTTMLVGVGLSQIGAIGTTLNQFSGFLAAKALVFPAEGSGAATAGVLPAVGPMILIFGVVVGFLGTYVYTRVVVADLFNRAEHGFSNAALERKPVSAEAAGRVLQEARALSVQTSDPTIDALANARTVSVGDALNLMFQLLYEPLGYERVINMAAELRTSPAPRTADYWYCLAAAYGQQHHALKINGSDEPGALDAARTNALNAAREAVARDPGYADRLWWLSDPDEDDDDLADFRSDPEFRRIVKRPVLRMRTKR